VTKVMAGSPSTGRASVYYLSYNARCCRHLLNLRSDFNARSLIGSEKGLVCVF